jgi:hypothetical protein
MIVAEADDGSAGRIESHLEVIREVAIRGLSSDD